MITKRDRGVRGHQPRSHSAVHSNVEPVAGNRSETERGRFPSWSHVSERSRNATEPAPAGHESGRECARAMVTIMAQGKDHIACVNAWMERVARPLAAKRLVKAFEDRFAALWWRARQTLGPVTLMAIVDRVLRIAAGQLPLLTSLKIEASGISCHELLASTAKLDRDQLAEGIRLMMAEFLTVLGDLTGEILTPVLHAELSADAYRALHKGKDRSTTKSSGRKHARR